MNTVKIDTAQNVQIDFSVASAGDRLLAFIIDYLVLVAYVIFISITVAYLQIGATSLAVIVSVPVFLYFLLCELFMNGQSIGKRARKIKVVMLNGNQASVGAYILRWIVRPIDYLLGIGFISIIVSKNSQRLGDIAAGTTVIKLKAKFGLNDTIFMDVEDDYKPMFTNATDLNSKHIELIKKILNDHKEVKNYVILEAIYEKTKNMLDAKIPHDMKQIAFLETVIKDYNYLINN